LRGKNNRAKNTGAQKASGQFRDALGRVNLDRPPRMADFAQWATACETAL